MSILLQLRGREGRQSEIKMEAKNGYCFQHKITQTLACMHAGEELLGLRSEVVCIMWRYWSILWVTHSFTSTHIFIFFLNWLVNKKLSCVRLNMCLSSDSPYNFHRPISLFYLSNKEKGEECEPRKKSWDMPQQKKVFSQCLVSSSRCLLMSLSRW